MKNIVYCLIISSFFCACDSFFEGKPIELNNKVEEGLAAYCILNLDDTTIMAQVGRVIPYGFPADTIDWGQENVIVELYQNGNLLFDIPIVAPIGGEFYNGIQFKKELNQPFRNFHQANAVYELVIQSAAYGTLRASQVFPDAVLIDTTNYREVARITGPFAEQEDLFEITFTDPMDEANYYWIDVVGESITFYDSMYFYGYYTLNSPSVYDGLLNIENNIVAFSDENINGQTYTIGIYDFTLKGIDPEFYLNYKLHSISKDLYRYLKTLGEYGAAAANPFAEPSLLHHNMEGGLGVFGVYQTTEKRVRIK